MGNASSRLATSLFGLSFSVVLALAAGCGPDYPNCDNDDQCHEGEFCVNHQCQDCRTDADCPAGQQCSAGACSPIDGYCDADHACPAGQECQNNRCQASASTDACANVTCPAGQHCESGGCVADSTPPPSCTLASVYVDYDSDAIDAQNRTILQSDARCIAELHPSNVHATGRADARGTEEYNLALSERRAIGVTRYLRSLGVSVDLTQSGVGEEMSGGEDEEGWRQDRRVDLHPR